ncbi:hypothetical protein JGK42_000479 [Aeromonas veronii]|nr:hypothetical protein [Aeromonas veronii]
MNITLTFIAGRLLPLRCIKEEAGKQERRQRATGYEELDDAVVEVEEEGRAEYGIAIQGDRKQTGEPGLGIMGGLM